MEGERQQVDGESEQAGLATTPSSPATQQVFEDDSSDDDEIRSVLDVEFGHIQNCYEVVAVPNLPRTGRITSEEEADWAKLVRALRDLRDQAESVSSRWDWFAIWGPLALK